MTTMEIGFAGVAAAFAAPVVDDLQSLTVVVIVLVVCAAIIVVGSLFVVFAAGAVDGHTDASEALGSAFAFFSALWVPVAWAIGRAASLASSVANFIFSNFGAIVGIAAFALAGWYYPTYAPEVKSALLPAYQLTWVPIVYNVPMRAFMAVRIAFESVYVWVNVLIIRTPSQFMFGLFFDLGTCADATWQVFFDALTRSMLALVPAIINWSSSDAARLHVAPDFARFGTEFGNTIGSLQLFSECLCESGSAFTEPLFATISQGSPRRNASDPDSPPSPFGQMVNTTLNYPVTLIMDIVRPFVLGIEAGQDSALSGGERWEAAMLSFNGTASNSRTLLNATLALGDSLVQQVYFSIMKAALRSSRFQPIVEDPGPMPSMFTLGVVLWIPMDIYVTVFNIIARVPSAFTTFDGQLVWRFTESIELLRYGLDVVGNFIEWIADLMRAIGAIIAGSPTACSGTSSDDYGPSIGGCILGVIASTFDFAYCALENFVLFTIDLFETVYEGIIGTIYTLITRAIFESETGTDWCVAPIAVEFQSFCSILPSPVPFWPLDFWTFQVGLRSTHVPFVVCPNELCSLPSCESDENCQGRASIGVATRCDTRWGRCVDTRTTCQSGEPTRPGTNCVDDVTRITDNTCTLGECSVHTCPVGNTMEFACDCQCPVNEYRRTASFLVLAVDCLGRVVVDLVGNVGDVFRCFIVNLACLFVEIVLLVCDVIAKIGILSTTPQFADISTFELVRAAESLVECINAGIRLVSSPSQLSIVPTTTARQLDLAVTAFTSAITCTASAVFELLEIVRLFVQFFITLAKTGIVIDITTIPADFIELLFVLLAALFQVIAGFFYVVIEELGDAFFEVGVFFKDNAALFGEATIALIEALFGCIVGFVETIFLFAVCLFQVVSSNFQSPCLGAGDWLDPLIECFDLIAEIIFTTINTICGSCIEDLLCFINEVACYITVDIDICTRISPDECEALNAFCFLEDKLCDIGIPIEIIACPYPFTCTNPGILCPVFDAFSYFVVVLVNLYNVIPFVPSSAIVTLLNDARAFTVPPELCCTTNNVLPLTQTNFDHSAHYSNPLLIVTDGTDAGCPILAQTGCWAYLTRAELIASGGISCPSRKRALDDDEAPYARHVDARTLDSAHVLGVVERIVATGRNNFARTCIGHVRECLDATDDEQRWPPYALLQSLSLSATKRLSVATCVDMLDTYTSHSLFAAYARNRTATTTPLHVLGSGGGLTRVLWPLTQTLGTFVHTLRCLSAYAHAPATALTLRPNVFMFAGAPHYQLAPEATAGACAMTGAIYADWLAPIVGNVLRGTLAGARATLRGGAQMAHRSLAQAQRDDRMIRLRTAGRTMLMGAAKVGDAFTRTHALRASHAAMLTLATTDSPDRARNRHGFRSRHTISSTPQHAHTLVRRVGGGTRARWPSVVRSRAVTSPPRVMAISDACNLRESPWQCCENQNTCVGCSVFDRLAFVLEDGMNEAAHYYQNDYQTRFTSCSQRQLTTNFGTRIPANEACPPHVCAQPECDTDAQCAISYGNATAPVCSTKTGRCVIEGDLQCVGQDGRACFRTLDDALHCAAGVCVNDVCTTTDEYQCSCRCPDTYLTVNKSIPFITNQFGRITLPCLINVTCVTEVMFPGGIPQANLSNNPFRGSFIDRKLITSPDGENFDLSLIDAIDALVNGFAVAVFEFMEDLAYRASLVAKAVALERFADEFILCDYDKDWYCPIADENAPHCCDDACEQRKQGTTLFNGFFWGFLVVGIPITLIAVLPCLSCCVVFIVPCWAFVFVPMSMQFAYGGGLFCYTSGVARIIIPFYMLFVVMAAVAMRVLTCCCMNVGTLISLYCTRMCRFLGALLVVLAMLPGASMCLGMDAYTLVQQVQPPCFPADPALIDRSMPGATTPCGTLLTDATFVAPTFINCVSSPTLAPTRFSDGLDSVFYLLNALAPQRFDELAASGTTLPLSLNKYLDAHTSAAHAASEPRTTACFRETAFPNILTALIVLAFNAALALAASSWKVFLIATLVTPLLFAAWSTWYAWRRAAKAGRRAAADANVEAGAKKTF